MCYHGRVEGKLTLRSNFRRSLDTLEEVLVEAIREAEQLEMHHQPEGSLEWHHYLRLLTAVDWVSQRRTAYDNAKSRATQVRGAQWYSTQDDVD